MFWLVLCTLVLAEARGQLPECTSSADHCPPGRFCEDNVCRDCLSCGDMHREPPRHHTECIKSVVECGACVEGYTQDRSGVSSDCAALDGGGVSPYVWLGLAVGFAVIVIVFTILVFLYLHRNTESLKIFTSTRASVHGQFSAPASAPQPPPPYHAPPYHATEYDTQYAPPPHHTYVEEASPLVKRGLLRETRGTGREAAGRQAARVYSNPAYVRHAALPGTHSPELSYEDESNPVEPFVPHDEDTMESVWTPQPATTSAPQEHGGNSAGAALSTAPEQPAPAPRRAANSDLAPPNKMICLPQDTNNNRSSDPGSSEDNPSAAGTSVTLNFNLNVNTSAVQQLNNVTL